MWFFNGLLIKKVCAKILPALGQVCLLNRLYAKNWGALLALSLTASVALGNDVDLSGTDGRFDQVYITPQAENYNMLVSGGGAIGTSQIVQNEMVPAGFNPAADLVQARLYIYEHEGSCANTARIVAPTGAPGNLISRENCYFFNGDGTQSITSFDMTDYVASQTNVTGSWSVQTAAFDNGNSINLASAGSVLEQWSMIFIYRDSRSDILTTVMLFEGMYSQQAGGNGVGAITPIDVVASFPSNPAGPICAGQTYAKIASSYYDYHVASNNVGLFSSSINSGSTFDNATSTQLLDQSDYGSYAWTQEVDNDFCNAGATENAYTYTGNYDTPTLNPEFTVGTLAVTRRALGALQTNSTEATLRLTRRNSIEANFQSGHGGVFALAVGNTPPEVDDGRNLGVANEVSLDLTQGNPEITFDLYLEAFGDVGFSNISLVDNLDATFGAGSYAISNVPQIVAQSGGSNLTLAMLPPYDGSVTTEILDSGNSTMAAGATAQIRFSVTITTVSDQGNGFGFYRNTATISGLKDGVDPNDPSARTTDQSDAGSEPDTDNDGRPNEGIIDAPPCPSDDPADECENDPTEFVTVVDQDFGDAPQSYGTRLRDGGASHTVTPGIFIGDTEPDIEADGFGGDAVDDSGNASDDDLSDTSDNAAGDDEDTFSNVPDEIPFMLIARDTYTLTVPVQNDLASPANLIGWIDFDRDNIFDSDEGAQIAVPPASGASAVDLTWTGFGAALDIEAGDTFMRLRMTSDPRVTTQAPTGLANDGEVEDYPFLIADPRLGAALRVSEIAVNDNGTYLITYEVALENFGNVELFDIQLTHDLANLGNPVGSATSVDAPGEYFISSPPAFTTQPTGSNLTPNANFSGNGSSPDLLVFNAGDSMPINTLAILEYQVLLQPNFDNEPFNTRVVATADVREDGDADADYIDFSDNAADPDTDGDDVPNEGEAGEDPCPSDVPADNCENDFTPLDIQQLLVIGAAKQVGAAVFNGDASFSAPYSVLVENLGNLPLFDVQVLDDLTPAFGTFEANAANMDQPGEYTIEVAPVLSGNSDLVVNANYDGELRTGLIDVVAGGSLAPGETALIEFTVRFIPNPISAPYNNQAMAIGDLVANGIADGDVTDLSDFGNEPDADDDGNPNETATGCPDNLVSTDPGASCENDPTPLALTSTPVIGAAKEAIDLINNGDGSYDVTYIVRLENFGNSDLFDVAVTDPLADNVGGSFGDFQVDLNSVDAVGEYTLTSPVTLVLPGSSPGNLTVNNNYNGQSVTDLLLLTPGDSLPIGARVEIRYGIRFIPDENNSPYPTQATASGDATEDNVTGGETTDPSDAGDEPDENGNNNPNEQSPSCPAIPGFPVDSCENDPTILILNNELFAMPDGLATLVNTPAEYDLTVNDVDPQGHNLRVDTTPLISPSNGVVVLSSNGQMTYTPNEDFTGLDTFRYIVCDDGVPQVCDQADVEIFMVQNFEGNQPPVSLIDSDYTLVNLPSAGNVYGNDDDPDGDTQGINVAAMTAQPENGQVTLNVDGGYLYTPNLNFQGTDSFEYESCDTSVTACSRSTVYIVVDDDDDNGTVNDPPYAGSDGFITFVNSPFTNRLALNDADTTFNSTPVSTMPRVSSEPVRAPMHGVLDIEENDQTFTGTFTYTPNEGFTGYDYFIYEVCDPDDLCTNGIAYIVVLPPERLDFGDAPITYGTLLDDDGARHGISDNLYIGAAPPDPEEDGYGGDGVDNSGNATDDDASGDDVNPDDEDGVVTLPAVLLTDSSVATSLVTVFNNTGATANLFAWVDFNADGVFTTEESTQVIVPSLPVSQSVVLTFDDLGGAGSDLQFGQTFARYRLSTDVALTESTPASLVADGEVEDYIFLFTDPRIGAAKTVTELTPVGNGALDVTYQIRIENVGNTPLFDVQVVDALSAFAGGNFGAFEPNSVDVDTAGEYSITSAPEIVQQQSSGTLTPNPDFNGGDDTRLLLLGATDRLTITGGPAIVEFSLRIFPQPANAPYFNQVVASGDVAQDGVADGNTTDFSDNGTVVDADGDGNPKEGKDDPTCPNQPSGANDSCEDDPTPLELGNETFAFNDTAIVVVGQDINANVLFNDDDFEGDVQRVTTNTVTTEQGVTVNVAPTGEFTYTPDPGFVGIDRFTYTVCDDNEIIACDTAVVSLAITANLPPNDPPVALDDTAFVHVNGQVGGNVLSNDSDPDGDSLIVNPVPVTEPQFGTVTLNSDGSYSYEPAPGFQGDDSFVYEVCDTGGNCTTATVFITVDDDDTPDENDPPIANDDASSIQQGGQASGNALENDSDPNNDAFTATPDSGTTANGGSFSIDAAGNYSYTPDPDFIGTDSFTYEICDSNGNCDEATIFVSVFEEVENELFALADVNMTQPDTPVGGNVLINDRDTNGNNLTVTTTPVSEPSNGTVQLQANGDYVYTPNAGFVGEDVFVYEVCDDGQPQVCDSTTVTVEVSRNAPANDEPDVLDDTAYTFVNTPVSGDLLNNDVDPDGDPLIVNQTPLTSPQNGMVVINVDGTYTYTPNDGFQGEDSFVYEACDSSGACQSAVVTITVDDDDEPDVNDPPVANDDAIGTSPNTPAIGELLTNDSDPNGDQLSVNIVPVQQPTNGTVTINADGSYEYVPNDGFSGPDRFVYEVCDDGTPQECSQATVYVNVFAEQAPEPVIGLAKDVSEPTNNFDGSFSVTYSLVAENLGNIELGDVQITDNLSAPFGTFVASEAEVDAAGEYTITAAPQITQNSADPLTTNANFTGQANADGLLDVGAAGRLAQGEAVTVTFSVRFVPDETNSPYANSALASGDQPANIDGTPDGDATDQSTPGGDPDPDGDGDPTEGGPNCPDDPAPDNDCENEATPLPPLANELFAMPDVSQTLPGQAVVGNVLLNDIDPENQTLTVNPQPVMSPANGTVTLNTDGSYNYVPNDGFVGTDTFSYEVCDDASPQLCDTTTVTIVVAENSPDNDPPTALNDTGYTHNGVPLTGDLLNNDSDPDGDELSINQTPGTSPANGQLTINSDGTYTYVPDDGFQGEDRFSYQVCDNGNPQACSVAEVVITVDDDDTPGVNDPAIGVDDAAATPVNTQVCGNVLANDFDPNGDALQATPQNVATPNGNVEILADGSYCFTPNADYIGPETIVYEVCDSNNACQQATLHIAVYPPEPAEPESGDTVIAAAKEATTPVNEGDGSFSVTYLVRVKNMGEVPLFDVQAEDDLATNFGVFVPELSDLDQGGEYTITAGPTVSDAQLTPNADFNGDLDVNLLQLSSGDNLQPNQMVLIEFTLRFRPNEGETEFGNSVLALGDREENGVTDGDTTDRSDAGSDPTGDGDDTTDERDPDDPVCQTDPEAPGCESDETAIKLDEIGSVFVTKSANTRFATVGDVIAYTVTVQNNGIDMDDLVIEDDLPGSFTYIDDSARLQRGSNSRNISPAGTDPIRFTFDIAANETVQIVYLLQIGIGMADGNYVNLATPSLNGVIVGNTARADVTVEQDPIFDQSAIIGKVFADQNGNGRQDQGEPGIPNVRIATVEGLLITTDAQGRWHVADIEAPQQGRIKQFIAKVDSASLPAGSTFTTENPRVIPLTRSLMSRVNFGVKLSAQAIAELQQPVKIAIKDEGTTIYFDSGEAKISEAYLRNLKLLLDRYIDRDVRVKITGHTDNQKIRGRLRQQFRDNDELSVARALQVAQVFSYRLNIPMQRIEIEGQGESQPVASNATAKGRSLNRRAEVTLLVDGKAVDTTAVSANVSDANSHFYVSQNSFDVMPKLDVVATTPLQQMGPTTMPLKFRMYTNYAHFIDRWELAIYAADDQALASPIDVLKGDAIDFTMPVMWDAANVQQTIRPGMTFVYVLRVYDDAGHVDETTPKNLLVLDANGRVASDDGRQIYGSSSLTRQTIPVYGAAVQLRGEKVADGDTVTVNNRTLWVDDSGQLFDEQILPPGNYPLNVVSVTANGETATRELSTSVQASEFFMVGLASVTLGQNDVSGYMEPLSGDEQFSDDDYTDGRLAFYLKGKIKGRYLITAQLDTTEDNLDNLSDNLSRKDGRSVFRRLDPDRYYPVYGDGSTTVSDVDTQGALYLRLDWDNSVALWGNYNTGFTGNEFAQYTRSLYGAQVVYRSNSVNTYGDHTVEFSAFGAEPNSAQAHNTFVATGGSLYYLKHTDLVQGSEKIWVEVRQRDTQQVYRNVTLVNGRDYQIDYIQGRIILSRPLSQVAREQVPAIISDEPLEGNDVFLQVDYEYIPEMFDEDVTVGARSKVALGDYVSVGGTYVNEDRENSAGTDYELKGVDATVKLSRGTYLAMEYAESESVQTNAGFVSTDGGLSFALQDAAADNNQSGRAYGATLGIDFNSLTNGDFDGQLRAWFKDREAGFSGATRLSDGIETTDMGVETQLNLTDSVQASARWTQLETGSAANQRKQMNATVQVSAELSRTFVVAAELRHEDDARSTAGNTDSVAATLAGVRLNAQLTPEMNIYLEAQGEIDADDAYEDNNQVSVGINAQLDDKLAGGLELISGDRGDALIGQLSYAITDDSNVELSAGVGDSGSVTIGSNYADSNGYELYGSYSADPDQSGAEKSTMTIGQRKQFGNGMTVYAEHQFSDEENAAGLAQSVGLEYALTDQWRLGLSTQLSDRELSNGGSIERQVVSTYVNYSGEKIDGEVGLEYRKDEGGSNDVDQYLVTTAIKVKASDDWTVQARANAALTHDENDDAADGRFVEASVGFAYRPIENDRFNLLGKYSFLYDLDTAEQFRGTAGNEKSQTLSLEGLYELSEKWELGAKVAYRRAELQLGRDRDPWYSSSTGLFAVRARYHFISNWDAIAEYRYWYQDESEQVSSGLLLGVYRHLSANLKVGVGYNFTDFSDDLNDRDYDNQGWFIDFIGKF